MPSYDALHYDPPVPIAQVNLRAANGAAVDDVLLLLDTGAWIPMIQNRRGSTDIKVDGQMTLIWINCFR